VALRLFFEELLVAIAVAGNLGKKGKGERFAGVTRLGHIRLFVIAIKEGKHCAVQTSGKMQKRLGEKLGPRCHRVRLWLSEQWFPERNHAWKRDFKGGCEEW